MSQLIANVHVPGRGWFGPAHGNAGQVPDDVAALITNSAVWDQPPEMSVSSSTANGEGAGDTTAGDPAPDPVDEAIAGLLGDHADTQVPDEPTQAELLAAVPDEKPALLAFRDAHGLDVDGRLGVEKLRHAIAAALGAS